MLKKIFLIILYFNSASVFSNERPPWFIPPPLDPTGVELETKKLDEGVYALLSNTPFADNAGFIVGKDCVLVVDAHFNGEMGLQIIEAVKKVTNLPIKYLVNLNAFGDHVFGNYVFPESTVIISHEKTLKFLKDNSLDARKKIISVTVEGDMNVFKDVKDRLPTLTFSKKMSLDLGEKIVELHYFGPGMSPSDSVLYVPSSKIAWTGNLVFGKGSIPWARSEQLRDYLETMKNFEKTIKPVIIVSGHGKIADENIVEKYINYLNDVIVVSKQLHEDKENINKFVSKLSLSSKIKIEDDIRDLMEGFHKWNVLNAYKQLN